MKNLFWPVYLNLEEEFIELALQIHIDDKQLNVYSTKIAELLVRCAIEIEALSKELYLKEGGIENPIDEKGIPRQLYYDTDCIDLLEQKWLLSKKEIIVSSPMLFLEQEENIILKPLYKANQRGTSGAKWAQAYQAVKHNRSKNLEKGNIKNVINALAALYLLNIYYAGDEWCKDISTNDKNTDTIDFDSEVFSVKIKNIEYFSLTPETIDDCYVCIKKYTDAMFKKISEVEKEYNKALHHLLITSPEYINFMRQNPNYCFKGDNLLTIANKIDKNLCISMIRQTQGINQRSLDLLRCKKELVLNKNQHIDTSFDLSD